MGNTAARRAAWPSQVAARERLPGVASHSVPTFDAVRPSSAPPRFGVVEEVIRSVHACASVFPGTAITTYPHHLVHALSKHGSIQIQQAPGCMKLFIESILLCQVASLHLASNIAQHVHSCVVHLHS